MDFTVHTTWTPSEFHLNNNPNEPHKITSPKYHPDVRIRGQKDIFYVKPQDIWAMDQEVTMI